MALPAGPALFVGGWGNPPALVILARSLNRWNNDESLFRYLWGNEK
jgi:hypothetical protein